MRRIKLFIPLLFASILLSSCTEPEMVPVTQQDVMGKTDSEKTDAENVKEASGSIAAENAEEVVADNIGEVGDFQGGHLMQTLPVKNEDFSLLIDYDTGEQSIDGWRITSSKYLNMTVRTENLPEGWHVYIDNVHIESSILSLYEAFDGITVDEMDDHTHSSLYPGFAINNENEYYGTFGIGGYSETLVSGYTDGYITYQGWGFSHGNVNEKRVTESELKETGVYGNKFQLVYDLYIQPADSEEPYMKSVISEFVIPTTFTVSFTDEYGKDTKGEALWNGTTFDVAAPNGNEYEISFAGGKYVMDMKNH